jgi:hypothetical protein
MEAYRNNNFYLQVTKEFTIACGPHCEYCSDLSGCTKCLPGYYFECETIEGEKVAQLWSNLIMLALMGLLVFQLFSFTIPDEFWLLFDSLQLV